MRVICPHVNRTHPLTAESLSDHVPNAEWFYVGGAPDSYWRLLCDLWGRRESFLLIEHDMELHEGVIPDLAECPAPICLFPYPGPTPSKGWSQSNPEDSLLYRSLGCTRFSAAVMAAQPNFMLDLTEHRWQFLDTVIIPGLMELDYVTHVHWPAVLQHHVWAGRCSCGTGHEPYKVDGQGRYVG